MTKFHMIPYHGTGWYNRDAWVGFYLVPSQLDGLVWHLGTPCHVTGQDTFSFVMSLNMENRPFSTFCIFCQFCMHGTSNSQSARRTRFWSFYAFCLAWKFYKKGGKFCTNISPLITWSPNGVKIMWWSFKDVSSSKLVWTRSYKEEILPIKPS